MNRKIEVLSQNHEIKFTLYENSWQYTNFFLRKSEKYNYQLYLLGKNGEPKVHQYVNF